MFQDIKNIYIAMRQSFLSQNLKCMMKSFVKYYEKLQAHKLDERPFYQYKTYRIYAIDEDEEDEEKRYLINA